LLHGSSLEAACVDECGLLSKVKSYVRFWIRFTEQGASNRVAKLRLTGAVIWWFKSVLKYVAKFRLTCHQLSWFWQRSSVSKVRWSMWSVLSLPSPTIRPREQADLARYRSFVVKKCGFGF